MKEELLTAAFTRARESLRAVARRFSSVGDDTVDDMLQDAFIRLWSSNLNPASVDEAMALSRTTVRNLAVDSTRRESVHRLVPIDEMADTIDDDNRQEVENTYHEVSRLIDNVLGERERTILYLRDRDGWEFEEIAQRFSLTEANVRVILSRARKTVRQIYIQRNK